MTESTLSAGQQISSIWDLGGLSWIQLARRAWGGINQNDLINRGYELAYSFLFAVFPLLLFLFALFGLFASEDSKLHATFLSYMQVALPPSAYQLVLSTLNQVASHAGGGKVTFGLLIALYSGSSGMTQLISTLNAAYEVHEGRSWLKVHLVSIGLTLAMSTLITTAVLLVLASGHIVALVKHVAELSAFAFILGWVIEWAVALVLVVFAFALIYYFAPDVKQRHWYWVTPGSLVGVFLWAAVSAGLRGYLYFFNNYTRTYGSLGAVIILLLWFYVTGLAFLIGGEINSTIEHAAAERGHPEAKLPGEKTETTSPEKKAA